MPSCCTEQDPWGEILTSQGVFIPKIVADECSVTSGTTGVLHFAVLVFDGVIQILQRNPVQNKPCMQADICMRIVFHVREKLQKLQLSGIGLGPCGVYCGKKLRHLTMCVLLIVIAHAVLCFCR